MIPTLGNFALWSSLCFAVLQLIISNKKIYYVDQKNFWIAANGLILSSFLSFLSLMYSYIISDFSVLNVFQNSHTSKPLIYKISGVWGNHEGSMLLWILVLTIFNFFIFKLYKKTNANFISKTLETQALICIGFILFTLFTSNPFERIFPEQANGLGFNPILQDPALAIHPPLLYIGYVGFSAAFSFSIATLRSENNKKIPWYSYMKPFVMVAWTFLSIGIAFGALWAYYELGWGGWWFWDPVENASFMPWLLGTALIHSLITVEKRKSLQMWVLLLSILVFLLSVVGTFLVRSGILTSVHTFALDPFRGIYILIFIAFLGSYSLVLFGNKSKKYFSKNYFAFLSKEGAILINNVVMTIVCASVFLGTIYPLIIEIFSNNKISVGEPYYNSLVVPIMFPAILIMGLASTLSWGKENILSIIKKNIVSIFLTTLTTVIFLIIYKSYNTVGIIGIALAFWIIVNNFLNLINNSTQKHSKSMILAHLGVGFLILGITSSSVWQEEKIVRMKIMENTKIHNYNIVFKEINEITGPNFVAIQGNFIVYDKEKKIITKLNPEKRFYPVTKNITTEASIHSNMIRDVYIVLGEGNINDGWVIKIYYNPLVIWIWIGSLTIFVGGLISMISNMRKINLIK